MTDVLVPVLLDDTGQGTSGSTMYYAPANLDSNRALSVNGGSLPLLGADSSIPAVQSLLNGQLVGVDETFALSGPRTITFGAATEVQVPLFIAPFPLTVTGLRVVTPTTQVASNTNYWICMLRRRRMSLPVNPYSAEVLADTPYEYWRLNETGGTTFASGGSNAKTLTMSATAPTLNQASLVRRASDPSALFVAASSTNAVATSYAWDFSGNHFTVEALIQSSDLPSGSQRRTIFSRPTTFGGPSLELGGSAGTGRLSALQVGNFQLETADYAILPNNVYHVVYRKNGSGAGTQDLFINGVKQLYGLTNANNQDYLNVSTETRIGSRDAAGGSPAGQFFNGYIDDVAVYMTSLSDARIQTHASVGAPLAEIGRKTTQTVASGGEGITAWQPWTFDPVPIDNYASICDKDDVVSASFYPVGTPGSLTDVMFEVTYEAL